MSIFIYQLNQLFKLKQPQLAWEGDVKPLFGKAGGSPARSL